MRHHALHSSSKNRKRPFDFDKTRDRQCQKSQKMFAELKDWLLFSASCIAAAVACHLGKSVLTLDVFDFCTGSLQGIAERKAKPETRYRYCSTFFQTHGPRPRQNLSRIGDRSRSAAI